MAKKDKRGTWALRTIGIFGLTEREPGKRLTRSVCPSGEDRHRVSPGDQLLEKRSTQETKLGCEEIHENDGAWHFTLHSRIRIVFRCLIRGPLDTGSIFTY